jgi:hypothetical protein
MSRRAESPDNDDADADGGGGVAFFNNGAAAASDTLLDEADEISWEDKLVRAGAYHALATWQRFERS